LCHFWWPLIFGSLFVASSNAAKNNFGCLK
jgi:hypothetical protein